LYNKPDNNIYTKLQALKTKYHALNTNPFIANLEPDTDTEARYYGIKFDNTFKATATEKQSYTDGLYNLLYNPQFYVPGDKTMDSEGNYTDPSVAAGIREVKLFAIKLAMHSFFVNGFRQGASSYADIVPLEFFTTPMKVEQGPSEPGVEVQDRISILDFFRQEAFKARQSQYFDSQDIINYMAAFGKMRAGGSNLVKRVSNDTLSSGTETILDKSTDNFIVVRNRKTGTSAVFAKLDQVKSGDGSIMTQYGRLEGTYTTKGSVKLYGLNYMKIQNKEVLPQIKNNIARSTTYLLDRGKLPIEAGNMSCSI